MLRVSAIFSSAASACSLAPALDRPDGACHNCVGARMPIAPIAAIANGPTGTRSGDEAARIGKPMLATLHRRRS